MLLKFIQYLSLFDPDLSMQSCVYLVMYLFYFTDTDFCLNLSSSIYHFVVLD